MRQYGLDLHYERIETKGAAFDPDEDAAGRRGFMGHESFNQIVAGLAEVWCPLLEASGTSQYDLGDVKVTETGRMVLEGRADHVELNKRHRSLARWCSSQGREGRMALGPNGRADR